MKEPVGSVCLLHCCKKTTQPGRYFSVVFHGWHHAVYYKSYPRTHEVWHLANGFWIFTWNESALVLLWKDDNFVVGLILGLEADEVHLFQGVQQNITIQRTTDIKHPRGVDSLQVGPEVCQVVGNVEPTEEGSSDTHVMQFAG